MAFEGLMVSVSGVRGRVGEAFTPDVACRVAAAFGVFSLARGGSRAIVLGRDIRASDDAGVPRVAVINEAMARKFWPDSTPLGRTLRLVDFRGELAYGLDREPGLAPTERGYWRR